MAVALDNSSPSCLAWADRQTIVSIVVAVSAVDNQPVLDKTIVIIVVVVFAVDIQPVVDYTSSSCLLPVSVIV